MVTTPIAGALFRRLCQYPPGTIWGEGRSAEARRLVARALRMVRAREGREAARALWNELTVCDLMP